MVETTSNIDRRVCHQFLSRIFRPLICHSTRETELGQFFEGYHNYWVGARAIKPLFSSLRVICPTSSSSLPLGDIFLICRRPLNSELKPRIRVDRTRKSRRFLLSWQCQFVLSLELSWIRNSKFNRINESAHAQVTHMLGMSIWLHTHFGFVNVHCMFSGIRAFDCGVQRHEFHTLVSVTRLINLVCEDWPLFLVGMYHVLNRNDRAFKTRSWQRKDE